MKLKSDSLKRLVRAILAAQPEEIGCESCFEKIDQYVDLHLAGRDAAEALPLVHAHLEHCPDCREEFEALLMAVQALQQHPR